MSSTLEVNEFIKERIDAECVRIFRTGLMPYPISNKEEAKEMIHMIRSRGITYISMFAAIGISDSAFRAWRNDSGNQNEKRKVAITNQVISFLNQRYQETNKSDSESDSDDNIWDHD